MNTHIYPKFTSNGQQKYRHAGVQWEQATKQKSLSLLSKNYCAFYIFIDLLRMKTWMNLNKMKMVKYEKFYA